MLEIVWSRQQLQIVQSNGSIFIPTANERAFLFVGISVWFFIVGMSTQQAKFDNDRTRKKHNKGRRYIERERERQETTTVKTKTASVPTS